MKKIEEKLLKNLQGKNIPSEVPLKNIKQEIGSLAYTEGNPLTKTEISLHFSFQIWDIINAIFIPPAALPVALQTHLPFYVFGLTDFYSGFFNGNTLLPPPLGWQRPGVLANTDGGIVGYTYPPIPGIGVPDVRLGDYVQIWMNTIPVPDTFVVYARIRCNNVAYGTFLNSFVSDLITINTIRYFVPAGFVNQFDHTLIFGYQSLFGKLKTDSLDPKMYTTPHDPQASISDIPIDLPIDKNMICCFNLNLLCQEVFWTLFVSKIEPLTHKKIK